MSHRWGRADSDISVSQNFCRIQRSWLVHMSTASADCAVLLKTLTSLQPPDGKDCCAIEGIVCQNGRLVQVNLGYKGLKGVLPEFSELTELQSFVVPGNALTGVMPDSLASLSKLTTLDIGLNTISGTIPPTLPKSLMELYVGYNHLTGNIPSFLGSLNQLQVLYLSNNTFSGGIPTTFGQLAQLSRLHMAFNQLTGSIPTELSLLSKLAQMDLDNNNLTGPIPTELLNLPSSAYIHLQQNLLSGTIPTSFFDRKLNISGNCFDGQTGHNPACGTLPSPPTTSKLNGVLIGGIVVGAVALLLIAGGIFLYFRRSRNPSKDNSSPSLPNADSVTGTAAYSSHGGASELHSIVSPPSLADVNEREATPLPVKQAYSAEPGLQRLLSSAYTSTDVGASSTPSDLQERLKESLTDSLTENVSTWTTVQVINWAAALPNIGIALAVKMDAVAIDGATLLKLTNEHMRDDLGLVKLNERMAFAEAVERLRSKEVAEGRLESAAPPSYVP